MFRAHSDASTTGKSFKKPRSTESVSFQNTAIMEKIMFWTPESGQETEREKINYKR